MDDLKNYRPKEQKMYIIANVFVLILLSELFKLQNIECTWFNVLTKILNSVLLSSSIYIFAYLADSLFSSGQKLKLLYFTGLTPGETIFSKLKEKNYDHRFTTSQLLIKYERIYADLPTDEKERRQYENSQWYHIYNRHRNVNMIFISNRDYLLCRDLYISTLVLLISYIISCSLFNVLEFNWKSILYLGAMLVVTNVAAHIKGRRFVTNVLAYDLQI